MIASRGISVKKSLYTLDTPLTEFSDSPFNETPAHAEGQR